MSRTKITAFLILLTAAFTSLLLFSSAPLARARSLKTVPLDPQSISAKFIGVGGMICQPGQSVNIKWLLDGDGVRYFETNPWSECELFFSTDGGTTWSRISPHLSVTRRNFEWFVPNISTQTGLLALQIGIEGQGEFYIFRSAAFTVLPGSR